MGVEVGMAGVLEASGDRGLDERFGRLDLALAVHLKLDHVVEDALPMVEELFGRPVVAGIEVRHLSLSTGEVKEAYRLLSLSRGTTSS